MGAGWQDVVTLLIVLAAVGFLVRKFVPGFSRKAAGGCAHCPSKSNAGAGSCCDSPVVISLSASPAPGARKKG